MPSFSLLVSNHAAVASNPFVVYWLCVYFTHYSGHITFQSDLEVYIYKEEDGDILGVECMSW